MNLLLDFSVEGKHRKQVYFRFWDADLDIVRCLRNAGYRLDEVKIIEH
jgi:hypothetical protein